MTLACFIKFKFANFLFEAVFTLNLNKHIDRNVWTGNKCGNSHTDKNSHHGLRKSVGEKKSLWGAMNCMNNQLN